MKILREYLGGSQHLDLDKDEDRFEWEQMICQDEEWANELAQRIAEEREVVINADQAEFVERYTLEAD